MMSKNNPKNRLFHTFPAFALAILFLFSMFPEPLLAQSEPTPDLPAELPTESPTVFSTQSPTETPENIPTETPAENLAQTPTEASTEIPATISTETVAIISTETVEISPTETATLTPTPANSEILDLFIDAGVPGAQGRSKNAAHVKRSRLVKLNPGIINGKKGTARNLKSNPQIGLNLFADVAYIGEVNRLEENSPDSISWIGKLKHLDLGYFYLVVSDGAFIAHIASPEGIYEVAQAGNDLYQITEIDQSQLEEADAVFDEKLDDEPSVGDEPATDGVSATADSSDRIDVMVLYTTAARIAEGSTAAMNARVDLAITETNDSYGNSGITPRLNLVYKGEISYTESGDMSTDLARLRNKSDGSIDQIHALRDTYKADQVTLVVESGDYCGIGYLMSMVSSAFESNAFTVVKRGGCMTGYYSYGHELGHNQGAHHDAYMNPTSLAYPYARGYVNLSGRWRTVMAYNNACSDYGFNCTRLKYWSNPNVLHSGVPMGIAASADNAHVLNNTAATVANFRVSISSPTATPVISLTPTPSRTPTAVPIPVPNDDFGSAVQMQGSVFGNSQAVDGATTATDDPAFACVSGQKYNTVWYRYTPSESGTLIIDTFGSSYDTVLAAWTGSRGALVNRACNDDSSGFLSRIQFPVSAGTDYLIEVASFSAVSSATLKINLSLALPLLTNSPGEGQIINISTPAYQWTRINGATKYQVQVFKGTTRVISKTVKASACDAISCATIPTTTLGNGTYTWNVRAYIGGVWTDYSSPKAFIISKSFNANFNGSLSGFAKMSGATWSVTSTALYTRGLAGKYSSAFRNKNIYDKLIFAASVKREGNIDDLNCLVVRAGSNVRLDNSMWYPGYAFCYNNAGNFIIRRNESDGSITVLQPLTESSTIVAMGWNTLKVAAAGNTFEFYINGNLMTTISDAVYTRGFVGFQTNQESIAGRFLVDWATLTLP